VAAAAAAAFPRVSITAAAVLAVAVAYRSSGAACSDKLVKTDTAAAR